ncbi:MAG: glycoside hydrolase family 97 N-terminal domain-containing protein, partial [Bacteroidales bacterium]|nr:glycoside hydrolase family 97 N-terminal domain-containing protein [Bacteroidales bacterium]
MCKKRIVSTLAILAFSVSLMALPQQYSLASPDGKVVVDVNTGGNISYSVSVDGAQVLSPSAISVTLNDG